MQPALVNLASLTEEITKILLHHFARNGEKSVRRDQLMSKNSFWVHVMLMPVGY